MYYIYVTFVRFCNLFTKDRRYKNAPLMWAANKQILHTCVYTHTSLCEFYSFFFQYKCLGNLNNYNVIGYNSSGIKYCNAEDIPNDIHFGVKRNPYKGNFIGMSLQLNNWIKTIVTFDSISLIGNNLSFFYPRWA